ncbi:hypothetical protein [Streptomyces kanamyceticus]|uniref:hypothetical protein n=1 Tax=Streptomyces kanamyceticus TaxID=1967 RepID=UPI0012FEA4EE|nr:hypothetical protein [Streptomyces kanamyceticus]
MAEADIKLSCLATDIMGICGRAILEALFEGTRDLDVPVTMTKARMRPWIPAFG